MDQVPPDSRMARVAMLVPLRPVRPTAMQDVPLVQETPFSTGVPLAGLGLGTTAQACPFHCSISVLATLLALVDPPTA
jgi:hypothetical protein